MSIRICSPERRKQQPPPRKEIKHKKVPAAPPTERRRVDAVAVISASGKQLMPTTRFWRVRRLLENGKAEIANRHPFTIRLKYETSEETQPVVLSIDSGRTNIGAVVTDGKGKMFLAAKLRTRNKEIPNLMADRKVHRQASRRGERLARKRLAEKNGTTAEFPEGRMLPGCEKPVPVKDIKNTESKFNNRKRPVGWLTPSATQLLRTLQSLVLHFGKFFPITGVAFESNKFAFMLLADGSVRGAYFQNGRLRGYASKEDYIKARQGGKCELCGDPIEHCHHLVPRREGGSDTPENLVGLYGKCHAAVHEGRKKINIAGFKKKYGGASVLNQVLPYFCEWLSEKFGAEHVRSCLGWETKAERERLGLPKDHHCDAYAIGSACFWGWAAAKVKSNSSLANPRLIRQSRRHNRVLVHHQAERTYKERGADGKLVSVAKNRKARFEQPKTAPSLKDWYEHLVWTVGRKEANRRRSQLRVVRSTRYYNDMGRILPGRIFRYGKGVYVLQATHNEGKQYRAVGFGSFEFPGDLCEVLPCNRSFVYL